MPGTITFAASWSVAAAGVPRFAKSRNAIPFWLLLAMIVVAGVWQHFCFISWGPPGLLWFCGMLAACLAVAGYTYLRAAPQLAEFSLFLGASLIYPLAAVRLSYLGMTLNRPLIDKTLEYVDSLVGFDWYSWMRFVETHPLFYAMHAVLYPSISYQSLIYMAMFSFLRPMGRNFEMLFLSLLGIILSIAVFTILPNLGPAKGPGVLQADIIQELRTGAAYNLPYVGLISFPSYHTYLAIMYVYCCRGIRLAFPIVLLMNGLMIITIPYGGDHNLIDMVAGAINASGCIYLCRRIYPEQSKAATI